MDREKRDDLPKAVLSCEVAFHTDIRKNIDLKDSMIALVPEYSGNMGHMDALFVVADGWKVRDLEGFEHNFSRTTVDTIKGAYEQASSQVQNVNAAQTLVNAMKQANSLIYQMQKQMRQDGVSEGDIEVLEWSVPPATCTALVIGKQAASLAHVGWCRVYLVRLRQVKQLTQDHSVVGEMIRQGKLTPQEARTHPRRGQIYRTLGESPDVEVDIYVEPVQDGDILVLCTRGLTRYMDDEELGRMIAPGRLQESVEELVQLARKRSLENDGLGSLVSEADITMIAVKISHSKG